MANETRTITYDQHRKLKILLRKLDNRQGYISKMRQDTIESHY